jgi:hypothetical protein
MATRFYFPSSGAPPATASLNSGGEWEHNSGNNRVFHAGATESTALTNLAYTPDGADHLVNADALVCFFQSRETLSAQTISAQTISGQFQCFEANAANNLSLTIKIMIFSKDGVTPKETILAITRDASEVFTSLRNITYSQASTAATVETGDRICIEIGLGGTPTAAGGVQGHNGTIRFGESAAGGDLPVNETETGTTFRPWLEFANTLSFATDITATTPTVTFSAPAQTVQATVNVSATTPVITFSAPTATITTGSAGTNINATTPQITFSAPVTTLLIETDIAATTPTVTFTNPAAVILADQILNAGTPVITFSAPGALVTAGQLLALGTPIILFSAPNAGISTTGVGAEVTPVWLSPGVIITLVANQVYGLSTRACYLFYNGTQPDKSNDKSTWVAVDNGSINAGKFIRSTAGDTVIKLAPVGL